MKFVSVATLLALAVATQANPLFDLPGLDLPGLDLPRVRTVTKTIYVTPGKDAVEPTPASYAPAQASNVEVASSGDVSLDGPAKADTAAPPAETDTAVASGDWITAMVCRINVVRAAHGAQPLGLSPELDALAQKHSAYQNSIQQMTHSDPAGGVGDRLTANGISWSTAAENVAAGMQTAAEAQDAWEHSPGHLANMVNPSLTYVGVGQVNSYYTQMFYGVSGSAPAMNVPKCN